MDRRDATFERGWLDRLTVFLFVAGGLALASPALRAQQAPSSDGDSASEASSDSVPNDEATSPADNGGNDTSNDTSDGESDGEGDSEATSDDDRKGEQTKDADSQEGKATSDSKTNDDSAKGTDTADDESASPMGSPVDGMPAPPTPPEEVADPKADEFEEFRKAYRRYAREIKDYQGTIDAIVDAEYKRRRSGLNKEYNRKSERLETIERQRRSKAIEKFKAFLDRHPNHPTYTPDAMFRLAELYFEQENDQFLQADEKYRRDMQRYRAGRRPSPPEAPRRDYSKTIDTFSKLVRNWPDYRLLDGAYYLLAYCEQKMGNPRKARDLFAELIVKRPKSEFVPEAWIRIGEYHFDRSDKTREIKLAKNAYEQAMAYEKSKFYDKALYKLAWSYYRLDRFDDAIGHFEQLVEYSDRQKEKTGEQGSVLRAEAIKYMAISLAEEDWDLDRKVDDTFGLPRIKKYLAEGKPYEREVLVKLVGRRNDGNEQGYLLKNKHYDTAVKVIRYTLDQYPKHPKNPRLHKQLILALTKADKVDQAFAERRKLLDRYGPDSEWYAYQKQQGNEEAIERGDDLVRENLIQAAKWYHQRAQQLKDKARVKQSQEMLAKSREQYKKAADAYERYLERYPDDKDIYRWNFYYADTLYYSGQYQRAHEQYRVVRELDLEDNKFQGKAAYSAVKALEFQLKKLVESGELPPDVVPSGSRKEARKTAQTQEQTPDKEEREAQKSPEGDEVASEKIPDLVENYITAMDRFVVLGLAYKQDEDVQSKFAFNAAKIYYDFKHFDTARDRFKWIVDNYPDREVAYLAGSLLLETYRREKKYGKMAEWADELSNVLKGEQAKAIKAEVRGRRLDALFKKAEQLFDAKKYEKAADKYMELVNKAPDYENVPLALNNTAVAYERVKKYKSAMKLYERVYREYPEHPLAGYALYRVGVNSERFFEFDKALQSYQLFYDKFEEPTPEKLQKIGFRFEDKRPKALLSSAVLSMNLQRYEEAAGLYKQFVETYPDNDQAAEAQWQIVESWRKADRKEKMVEAIRTYRETYGDKPERAERVLEGMMRIAEWHVSNGEDDEAEEMYNNIIETFKKREVSTGSPSAYYAAKAKFELAEKKYQTWKSIKIEGSLQQQKKRLQEKIDKQKKVASAFQEVWTYQNLEWTLAAGFRIGSLFQHFAEALYAVPIPFKVGTKPYRLYRKKLENIAIPLEDKAVSRYEKTIKKARQEKIVNKWTKKTLEQLNKYRPKQYPLYKEERRAKQTRPVTGRSLMTSSDEKDAEESSSETSPSEDADAPSEGSSESGDSPSNDGSPSTNGSDESESTDGTSSSEEASSEAGSSNAGDSDQGETSNDSASASSSASAASSSNESSTN